MDNNALTPDAYEMPTLNAEPIAAVEEQVVEIATQDDKELAALNMSRGWNRIATTMQADIDDLRTMRTVDLKGLTVTEVGQRYLVASTVADHLQKYLSQVTDATKVVLENERKN